MDYPVHSLQPNLKKLLSICVFFTLCANSESKIGSPLRQEEGVITGPEKENVSAAATMIAIAPDVKYYEDYENYEDYGDLYACDDDEDCNIYYKDKDIDYAFTHVNCDYDDRPIISQSTWRHARELYAKNTPSNNVAIPDPRNDGFSVLVDARKAPGKGRGIFATQDIKKGQLIWNPSQTAHFTTGAEFRDFIMLLSDNVDNDFVCDALNFSYVQKMMRKGDVNSQRLVISIDLDEGALCNDYDNHQDEANLGCEDGIGDEYDGGCGMNYFALRDIKAGEEFICKYNSFVAMSIGDFGI